MGLFDKKKDAAEPDVDARPLTFHPDPTEYWEPTESPFDEGLADLAPVTRSGTQEPARPARTKAGAASTKKPVTKKKTASKKKPAAKPATLREEIALIGEEYGEAPIEEMVAEVKKALAAHGQDVPDEWVTSIVEGLRSHGQTEINLGEEPPR